jgi:hypothetical protein
MSTVVRQFKVFTGGAHTDGLPSRVDARDVRKVHMFDVPAVLRGHALAAVGDMSGGAWWTVGEFRYVDTPDGYHETAVARRVGAQIQYGIEK